MRSSTQRALSGAPGAESCRPPVAEFRNRVRRPCAQSKAPHRLVRTLAARGIDNPHPCAPLRWRAPVSGAPGSAAPLCGALLSEAPQARAEARTPLLRTPGLVTPQLRTHGMRAEPRPPSLRTPQPRRPVQPTPELRSATLRSIPNLRSPKRRAPVHRSAELLHRCGAAECGVKIENKKVWAPTRPGVL